MKTTFEETKDAEAKKADASHTWAGFWLIVFLVSSTMACWGTPDLIDAWIYYLSDGYYK